MKKVVAAFSAVSLLTGEFIPVSHTVTSILAAENMSSRLLSQTIGNDMDLGNVLFNNQNI